MNTIPNDTIIALATPSGVGAVSVIRISGPKAIKICNEVFVSKYGKKDLTKVTSHTIHLGSIVDKKHIIDEVLVSVFKNPQSYTGEDVVEINCHGSVYIQQEILQLFIKKKIRHANAGEFTLRAFLNSKMDLSQAEAVADLIASDSAASHQVALQQMRGGFSSEIQQLRQQLLNFASLIELELDFSEEDVEFANRDEFTVLINKIEKVLKRLIDSFALGNVFKNGIPIAIVGKPNVGKSTLLNTLLNEDKAIISHIAGTTRDVIEDEIIIKGIAFRFIDTAGIRETKDEIESIGIQKTYEKIDQAQVVLYLFDASKFENNKKNVTALTSEIKKIEARFPNKNIFVLANKIEYSNEEFIKKSIPLKNIIPISAKEHIGIPELIDKLTEMVNMGALHNNETIVSNSRHFEALTLALQAIKEVQKGLKNNLSGDLLAIDIRKAIYHLGEITGEITNDDLLGNIFANFCIGK